MFVLKANTLRLLLLLVRCFPLSLVLFSDGLESLLELIAQLSQTRHKGRIAKEPDVSHARQSHVDVNRPVGAARLEVLLEVATAHHGHVHIVVTLRGNTADMKERLAFFVAAVEGVVVATELLDALDDVFPADRLLELERIIDAWMLDGAFDGHVLSP
jgi:hypothetical protein